MMGNDGMKTATLAGNPVYSTSGAGHRQVRILVAPGKAPRNPAASAARRRAQTSGFSRQRTWPLAMPMARHYSSRPAWTSIRINASEVAGVRPGAAMTAGVSPSQ
mgnify:CR=1 FL=1